MDNSLIQLSAIGLRNLLITFPDFLILISCPKYIYKFWSKITERLC